MAVTFDSKLKDIMACPEAVAVLEEMVPGISKNPGLKMIANMSLRKCCKMPQAGFTPEMIQQLEERINSLGK